MIRRINPFLVLGILAFVLVLFLLGVQKRETGLKNNNKEIARYEAKAKMLKELKHGWSHKNVAARLNALAFTPKLQSNTKLQKNANKITMTISNIEKNEADKIIKDFLNQPFEIKKFSIKRVSKEALLISVEVSS